MEIVFFFLWETNTCVTCPLPIPTLVWYCSGTRLACGLLMRRSVRPSVYLGLYGCSLFFHHARKEKEKKKSLFHSPSRTRVYPSRFVPNKKEQRDHERCPDLHLPPLTSTSSPLAQRCCGALRQLETWRGIGVLGGGICRLC
jgi:hypothetical protein